MAAAEFWRALASIFLSRQIVVSVSAPLTGFGLVVAAAAALAPAAFFCAGGATASSMCSGERFALQRCAVAEHTSASSLAENDDEVGGKATAHRDGARRIACARHR